jgi:hypothetical protein
LAKSRRLLNLLMDGLRYGAPGARTAARGIVGRLKAGIPLDKCAQDVRFLKRLECAVLLA